ncbi:hypothetical protein RBSWK_03426 [Rhodopirellula baltica SWK14]|uniref:Uncharacterized protein n=1 Tax=Rhodopirellula baltica SWK14 TaxID=993516 RepID=L7CHX3_RHOBT|nr:hypothetical protein RBSWK_03426 [Rhodopirellula baltica SWK14]
MTHRDWPRIGRSHNSSPVLEHFFWALALSARVVPFFLKGRFQ